MYVLDAAVGACVALYAHVQKTAIEDAARLCNGLIPANDDHSGAFRNNIMQKEFHTFPTTHKAGDDFL
ncbi:hypothetical protein PRIPAC_84897 [Pristionchus pacificus]|uniref:Uncharacterized protein n=1 Tax=Pristionchus pacificus TaxID=54126 RepID=A0A454XUT3_PRIPA|nr:hypothetical protein PRIPAC_84897 [Pristionchus pacificus]|eukprot:PDM65098.1 hypothetical protein PRIPAC_53347 [Pristionchus pacificus]